MVVTVVIIILMILLFIYVVWKVSSRKRKGKLLIFSKFHIWLVYESGRKCNKMEENGGGCPK